MQTYDELHDLPPGHANYDIKLSLENASPTDIPQLEHHLISLPELTLENIAKLQKNDTFCKNIIQHIDCNKHETSLCMPQESYIKR